MAQDIRDLLKNEALQHEDMPKNHETRFLEKLENAMPETKKPWKFSWFNIAASIVLLIGLGFGAYSYFQPETGGTNVVADNLPGTNKTLGDVSPGLKKVEDYYLASINLELSKMKPTAETKDLFDGYLEQLDELNKEYKHLSLELTKGGPSELTVNALIDNLKMRLNLLYRLKEQLKTLNVSDDVIEETLQTS
ncbi:hypothetical protein [Algibacter sp. 2305UL17-15]|uniref:hypothetical protein n=1 Tax=Algibacter sp. 2305UL17-15 TaxID=3231268 RepID=UPI00345B2048